MTFEQIIRGAIPNADHELVDHILWGRTPFPFTKLSARDIYKAADRFRRASDHGITLCDCCDNIAVQGDWCCKQCGDALRQNDEPLPAHPEPGERTK